MSGGVTEIGYEPAAPAGQPAGHDQTSGGAPVITQTVFLVDGDEGSRASVARILTASGFAVQSYRSAEEFLEHEQQDRPGCVLSDLRLPGRDGLDLFGTLHASGRFTPMIFMTAVADVPSSVRAMKKGAVDFLMKPVAEETLVQAVRQALTRDRDLRSRYRVVDQLRARYGTLTPREAEVFWLVTHGMLNKQIARDLGISQQTVKVHRRRVMQKMRAQSLAVLVHQADLLGGEIGVRGTEPNAHRRAG